MCGRRRHCRSVAWNRFECIYYHPDLGTRSTLIHSHAAVALSMQCPRSCRFFGLSQRFIESESPKSQRHNVCILHVPPKMCSYRWKIRNTQRYCWTWHFPVIAASSSGIFHWSLPLNSISVDFYWFGFLSTLSLGHPLLALLFIGSFLLFSPSELEVLSSKLKLPLRCIRASFTIAFAWQPRKCSNQLYISCLFICWRCYSFISGFHVICVVISLTFQSKWR